MALTNTNQYRLFRHIRDKQSFKIDGRRFQVLRVRDRETGKPEKTWDLIEHRGFHYDVRLVHASRESVLKFLNDRAEEKIAKAKKQAKETIEVELAYRCYRWARSGNWTTWWMEGDKVAQKTRFGEVRLWDVPEGYAERYHDELVASCRSHKAGLEACISSTEGRDCVCEEGEL